MLTSKHLPDSISGQIPIPRDGCPASGCGVDDPEQVGSWSGFCLSIGAQVRAAAQSDVRGVRGANATHSARRLRPLTRLRRGGAFGFVGLRWLIGPAPPSISCGAKAPHEIIFPLEQIIQHDARPLNRMTAVQAAIRPFGCGGRSSFRDFQYENRE